MDLDARGDASWRQKGSASVLEEMGLDARGGPPALWRRWEWTPGEVHLGAGEDGNGRQGRFALELGEMGLDIWGKRVGAFGTMLWEGVHLDKESRLL